MKKSLFLLVFTLFFVGVKAQFSNYVLGRYYGSFIQRYGGLQFIKNCAPGGLEFIPFLVWQCPQNCIQIIDSTDCQFSPPLWRFQGLFHYEVRADSSIGLLGVTNSFSGKLYENDSLFIRYKEGTHNMWDDFSGFKIYSSVGINQLKNPENQIQISPLPAKEEVYVQSFKATFKNLPEVYDVKGTRMECSMQKINANTVKLTVLDLPPAIYFLRIETQEEVLMRKMVVEH